MQAAPVEYAAPIINLRDLHDKKYNPDGSFPKYKCRQVAGGHMHGVNQCYWYADANLGGESEDRKPRGCHVGMMNRACIDMCAKKQASVQIATAASEIVEATNCALDAVAIRNLLKEMGWSNARPQLFMKIIRLQFGLLTTRGA